MKYRIGFYSQIFTTHIQKKLLEEGHEVVVWYNRGPTVMKNVKQARAQDISGLTKYEGYHTVAHYDDPIQAFKDYKVDFVFSDYNEVNDYLSERMKAEFKNYIFPSTFTDVLETNRAFGKMVAAECGLELPRNGANYKTKEEAIEFLKTQSSKAKFALKGLNNSALPPTRADAIDLIKTDPYSWFTTNGVYIESIVEGVECAFGGYYSSQHREWSSTFYINREHKCSHNGDLGNVLTGEVGTTIYALDKSDMPGFIMAAFNAVQPLLDSSGYTGYFDMNTILTGNGCYFLEYTTRVGYPTVEHQLMTGLNGKYGEFLAYLAGVSKQDPTKSLKNTCCVSAALFGYGLGLHPDIDKVVTHKPILNINRRKYNALRKAEAKWGYNIDHIYFDCAFEKDNVIRALDWERIVFVNTWGKLDTSTHWVLSISPLAHRTQWGLSCFNAWGYISRSDVGLTEKEGMLQTFIDACCVAHGSTTKNSKPFTTKVKYDPSTIEIELFGELSTPTGKLAFNNQAPEQLLADWQFLQVLCYDYNRVTVERGDIVKGLEEKEFMLLALKATENSKVNNPYKAVQYLSFVLLEKEKGHMYVADVVTAPWARKQKLASKLFNILTTLNIPMRLDCEEELKAYYEQQGFEEVKTAYCRITKNIQSHMKNYNKE